MRNTKNYHTQHNFRKCFQPLTLRTFSYQNNTTVKRLGNFDSIITTLFITFTPWFQFSQEENVNINDSKSDSSLCIQNVVKIFIKKVLLKMCLWNSSFLILPDMTSRSKSRNSKPYGRHPRDLTIERSCLIDHVIGERHTSQGQLVSAIGISHL